MRAAEALKAYAAEYPCTDVAHWDAMDHVSAGFRAIYTDFYLHLVNRHPAVWGYVYQKSDNADPDATMQKLRRTMERVSTRKLRAAINQYAPDAIICTHFLPAEMLAREITNDRLGCPVWVQVTDFDLHSMWLQPRIQGYFAASAEVAFRMQAKGIPAASTFVTGIPVMPVFSQTLERARCAATFGLNPARPIILLMSGGAGIGDLDKTVQSLLAMQRGVEGGVEGASCDFQVVALAGKNSDLLSNLQQLAAAHPTRLKALGFSNQVAQLMACADLVITKPGGLTTSECLAMGVPMIIHSPIPGQEERNADYLLEQGAALKAIDLTALSYRLQMLLQHPTLLAQLRTRCLALGRPHAGRTVLEIVFKHLDAHYATPASIDQPVYSEVQ
ncbi:MGDG synthase family glycosyltransferase [Glaciimonas immobilis]|uniref:Processive 1,2-diacylglycerol beta-glucosyltransferase n=1 Tax=Glaciimonas immobilis TaxID=728004 RepID=A0A840RSQ1_9BURK|nr:glycosyltransferase [Glaciimonas immobilis]KAF3996901.1 galactosyldiacylglycerol synthase [Glaciimonas immobilis]MBB5199714.1 processive 1,2-diacylglycerol beta-glucosyltransferase [Glaciimonas immobilis]